MKQIIKNILHHSEIFEQPVNTEFTELSEEREQLVIKLIKSELNELIGANTIDEQKDGCGDVLWTVLRAFMEYGVKNENDFGKHKNKFTPFLRSINCIESSLHKIRNESIFPDSIEDELDYLLYFSNELFKPFGYDRDYIMEQVYKSNMSKLCITETEAQATVKAYFEGTHPNKLGVKIEAYYKKAKQGFVVYRKSDNKYLKSINFVEPKFN